MGALHLTVLLTTLAAGALVSVAPAQAQSLTEMQSFFKSPSPPRPVEHKQYGVEDWSADVTEKAVEFKSFRLIVIANPNLTDEEKARRIGDKLLAMRSEMKSKRKALYEKVERLAGIGNSITKGYSGPPTKESGAKCTAGPLPNLFTQPTWARGAARNGDAPADAGIFNTPGGLEDANRIVTPDGDKVCAVAVRKSGKGRQYSYSEATFRLRPAFIEKTIEAEARAWLYDISTTDA